MNITEQGNVASKKKSKLPDPVKRIPFNKQEGVVKTIKDYNVIINGASKKGLVKQQRIKDRVSNWIESGFITNDDLKN